MRSKRNAKWFGRSAMLIAVMSMLLSQAASAQPAWYYGTVNRIYLYSSGFVVTMNSGALDDCKYKYVYFKVSEIGDTQVDRAYAMVLSAQASGRTLGVVIDKSINGAGGDCLSNGSMDIKD